MVTREETIRYVFGFDEHRGPGRKTSRIVPIEMICVQVVYQLTDGVEVLGQTLTDSPQRSPAMALIQHTIVFLDRSQLQPTYVRRKTKQSTSVQ